MPQRRHLSTSGSSRALVFSRNATSSASSSMEVLWQRKQAARERDRAKSPLVIPFVCKVPSAGLQDRHTCHRTHVVGSQAWWRAVKGAESGLARRRAEAEAAEAEALLEVQRAKESKTFTLSLEKIRASHLPSADGKNGLSDPYASFRVTNARRLPSTEGHTERLFNVTNPSWRDPVLLKLPKGSEAAMTLALLMRVELFDDDFADEDDPLGSAEVFLDLAPSGAGMGAMVVELSPAKPEYKQAEAMSVSFEWRLSDQTPLWATELIARGVASRDQAQAIPASRDVHTAPGNI